MINKPNISVNGKPSEKIFNCGADLVITPNEKFTIKMAVIAGNGNQ